MTVLGYDEAAPAVIEDLSTSGCRLSLASGIAVGTSLAIVAQDQSVGACHALGTVVRSDAGDIRVRFGWHDGVLARFVERTRGAAVTTHVYVI